jgi:hypothetical protein
MKIVIPKLLVDALKAGSVVPFVGAGLSRAADSKMPAWNELLETLLNECRILPGINRSVIRELEALFGAADLEELAERIRVSLPPSVYIGQLESIFNGTADTRDLRFHREVVRIKTNVVVTTNYDRLLEHSFARGVKRSPEVIRHDQASLALRRLRRPLATRGPLIYKLHGDTSEPSSIVLTRRDFANILFGSDDAKRFMSTLVSSKTLLFIGYSLRDRDINNHLEEYQTLLKGVADPHYMLVDVSRGPIDGARIRSQFGVVVIEYRGGPGGAGLLSALRQLADVSQS